MTHTQTQGADGAGTKTAGEIDPGRAAFARWSSLSPEYQDRIWASMSDDVRAFWVRQEDEQAVAAILAKPEAEILAGVSAKHMDELRAERDGAVHKARVQAAIREAISDSSTVEFHDISDDGVTSLAILATRAVLATPAPAATPGVPDSVREALDALWRYDEAHVHLTAPGQQSSVKLCDLMLRAGSACIRVVREIYSTQPAGQAGDAEALTAFSDAIDPNAPHNRRKTYGQAAPGGDGRGQGSRSLDGFEAGAGRDEPQERDGRGTDGALHEPIGSGEGLGSEHGQGGLCGDQGFILDRLTNDLVERFASALKAKLSRSERKYGWNGGWLKDDWEADCQRDLARHVAKGDPLDVAAYAAFCWHHGWPSASRRSTDFVTGAVIPTAGAIAAYETRYPEGLLSETSDNAIEAWNRVAAAVLLTEGKPAPNSTRTGAAETEEPWKTLALIRDFAKSSILVRNDALDVVCSVATGVLAARPEAPSDAGWSREDLEAFVAREWPEGRSAGAAARELVRALGVRGLAPTLQRLLTDLLGQINFASTDRAQILADFANAAPEAARMAKIDSFERWNPRVFDPTPPSDPAPSGQAEG